jgi:shikimate dehydrogenase
MNALPGRLILLGHPVSHSLSPVFQNAALRAAGIDLRYETLDVPPASLAAALDEARAGHWAGNVTIPHKEAVRGACTSVTAVAARAGAVNAFRASPSGIVGHNTDVQGIRHAIRSQLEAPPADIEFGVIGAGGSAAAVLTAIEGWSGCRAIVANRGPERLGRLIERFSSVARAGDVAEIAARATFVINATSLGMRDQDELPIDPAALRAGASVLDLVYAPDETRLVREARGRGLRAADGLVMLVAQGAAAFEWWFGVSPDAGLMWRSARDAASSRR